MVYALALWTTPETGERTWLARYNAPSDKLVAFLYSTMAWGAGRLADTSLPEWSLL